MIRHVEETVSRYVEELRKHHSGLIVELVDGGSPWIDAHLRVKCTSDDQVCQVLETVARLTSDIYMDDGVYITASPSFSGPFPQSGR